MNIITATKWLNQNVMNPTRERKEIFIATKGDIAAAPRRSKAPKRETAPRNLANKMPKPIDQNQKAIGLVL